MRTIAAILVAVVVGWVAREVSFDEPPAAAQWSGGLQPAEEGRAEARPTFSPVARKVERVEMPRESLGERNLFAYRERAAAEPARFVVVEEQRAPVVAVVEAQPAAEVQPQFAYRFIGTFGTRERRLAAFSRDGEVIAVRAGAKIGTDFVLRSIGIESVEVQPLASASVQRVALGQ